MLLPTKQSLLEIEFEKPKPKSKIAQETQQKITKIREISRNFSNLLYVSGEKIETKAHTTPRKIIDLEDGTHEKDAIRTILVENADLLKNSQELNPNEQFNIIRINNPIRSIEQNSNNNHGRKDLDAIKKLLESDVRIDALNIPKLKTPRELKSIKLIIRAKIGKVIPLILTIETPEAHDYLEELISDPNVIGLIPGAQDYALELAKEAYYNWIKKGELSTTEQFGKEFTRKFSELQLEIPGLAAKYGKIAIGNSSFSKEPDTQKDLDWLINQVGFQMRTAIHPNQIPKEKPPHNPQNSERKELFFPELPIQILLHYLEQSASNDYFNSDKPETDLPENKIIPTMYGPPVKETIFIMAIMYLNQLKKEAKSTPQIHALEELLNKVKQKYNYKEGAS